MPKSQQLRVIHSLFLMVFKTMFNELKLSKKHQRINVKLLTILIFYTVRKFYFCTLKDFDSSHVLNSLTHIKKNAPISYWL